MHAPCVLVEGRVFKGGWSRSLHMERERREHEEENCLYRVVRTFGFVLHEGHSVDLTRIFSSRLRSKFHNPLSNSISLLIHVVVCGYRSGYLKVDCSWPGCDMSMKVSDRAAHWKEHIQSRGITTFVEPGDGHVFQVPKKTKELKIQLWGAGGASGSLSACMCVFVCVCVTYNMYVGLFLSSYLEHHPLGHLRSMKAGAGGGGSFVEAIIPVFPGETLYITIGSGGQAGGYGVVTSISEVRVVDFVARLLLLAEAMTRRHVNASVNAS